MAQSKKLFYKTLIFMTNYLRKSTNFKIEAKKFSFLCTFKGTVRPDWICMRVLPLDRPWKGHQPLKVFLFFILNILWEFKVLSRFMQKWIQPPACLDHSLHVLKARSFPPNRAPKMRERNQLFFGFQLVSKEFKHPAIQTKIEQNRVFCQIYVQEFYLWSNFPGTLNKSFDVCLVN